MYNKTKEILLMFYYTFDSYIGMLTIAADEKNIKAVFFGEYDGESTLTPLISNAVTQLNEYFNGERKVFSLPLCPDGTDFQKSVWNALTDIPYGKTASYKEIAERINVPKGARAVGNANNKNPIVIIIPCHRVIGADGKLSGYGGGTDIKKKLLNLEERFR
jgi:methylated-DNA-[protein]-cysteine S-methyltransferase